MRHLFYMRWWVIYKIWPKMSVTHKVNDFSSQDDFSFEHEVRLLIKIINQLQSAAVLNHFSYHFLSICYFEHILHRSVSVIKHFRRNTTNQTLENVATWSTLHNASFLWVCVTSDIQTWDNPWPNCFYLQEMFLSFIPKMSPNCIKHLSGGPS